MNIVRTTILSLPLLLVAHAALADSEDKRHGAAQPPAEEQAPATSAAPAPAPEQTPAPAQAPAPAVGTTTTTSYTPAEQPEETKPNPVGNRLAIEPLVGAGTGGFGFGTGGRIGYTFKLPVYIGGTFMWYGGKTDTTTGVNGVAQTKSNFYYPGVEVGYDIALAQGRFVVRPYGAAAIEFVRDRVSVNSAAVADTSSHFMMYPGITAHYNIPKAPIYVGADTRLLIPFTSQTISFQGFFVAGLSL